MTGALQVMPRSVENDAWTVACRPEAVQLAGSQISWRMSQVATASMPFVATDGCSEMSFGSRSGSGETPQVDGNVTYENAMSELIWAVWPHVVPLSVEAETPYPHGAASPRDEPHVTATGTERHAGA